MSASDTPRNVKWELRIWGLRMAILAHAILLIASFVVYYYRCIWLPQFPEGGLFGAAARSIMIQVIPNAMLLTLAMMNLRLTPFAGLVTLVAVFLFTNLTHVLGSAGAGLWIASLIGFAIAAVVSKEDTFAAMGLNTNPFRDRDTYILISFAGVLTSFFWAPWLLFGLMFSGPGYRNPDNCDPDADYATRRAWGQKELVDYFDYMDKWARRSSVIRPDIGTVTGVAPIGWMNEYQAYFGDPADVEMNLQVIGERGEGILNLPALNLNKYNKETYGFADDSTWNFNGKSTSVTISGGTWLQNRGFDDQFQLIRDAATAGEHQQVFARWKDLQQSLKDGVVDLNWHERGQKFFSERFSTLPHVHRQEILMLLGDSHANLGENERAIRCYLDAAVISLQRIDASGWYRAIPRKNVDPELFGVGILGVELEHVRAAIVRATELDNQHKSVKRIARRRALLAYRFSQRRKSPELSLCGDDEISVQTSRELGAMYLFATQEVQKPSWLRERLGRVLVRARNVHRSGGTSNRLAIDQNDRYWATVGLEVVGSTGISGTLSMQLSERAEHLPPIDLFAQVPRPPGDHYEISNVYWKEEGKKHVRLDAATFSPKAKAKLVSR